MQTSVENVYFGGQKCALQKAFTMTRKKIGETKIEGKVVKFQIQTCNKTSFFFLKQGNVKIDLI